MKKKHILLDPKNSTRYMRRHPEERGLLLPKERLKKSRESFLDKQYARK